MRSRGVGFGILLAGMLVSGVANSSPAAAADDSAVRGSVVKIFATLRPPDTFRPWQKAGPTEATGTGVVIEGKRILTNAHVVNYASQVFVQADGSSEKLPATVVAVSGGIDLAMITLKDESFFEKRPPLKPAKGLPEIKDKVLVYGYPTGGSSLSVTEGIVSRIEFVPYAQRASGLRIQIDAAVNPGNSGGPAVVNGEMTGVTFSRLGGGDNIGYIIPSEEVEIFLKDVSDGKFDGKPLLRDLLQTLENDALKEMLGAKKAAGMVVHQPYSNAPDYPLKKWDIVSKIGDHEIDNTGMVRIRPNLRVGFFYQAQHLVKDDKIPLTIVRSGKELKVELPVPNHHDELVKSLNGKYPSYFIMGPLTFSAATAEYTANFERGPNLQVFAVMTMIRNPVATRRGEREGFPGEELVVVAAPMFPHRIAKGYSNPITKTVKEVNGIPIKNLRHLVEVFRDAKDQYIRISFVDMNSETMVFNRAELPQATEEILSDNGVRRQYSEDLEEVWTGKNKKK